MLLFGDLEGQSLTVRNFVCATTPFPWPIIFTPNEQAVLALDLISYAETECHLSKFLPGQVVSSLLAVNNEYAVLSFQYSGT